MLLLVSAIAGPVAADTVAPSVPVSWSVEPVTRPGAPDRPNFVLDAAPGDVVEDALAVQNLGDVDLVLGVYASDAFNTTTGGIDLLAAGEAPEDLGSWVRLDETSITVPAGGAVEVPFSVDVPADADPGDHVGGIVTSLRVTEADAEGNRLAVERRLGTRIHLRVDGTLTPELTFTELDADHSGVANPFAPGSMRLTYRVENTGNVRLRATRTATVDPTWGPTVTAEAADMAELLPGNSYVLTQTVPGNRPACSSTPRPDQRSRGPRARSCPGRSSSPWWWCSSAPGRGGAPAAGASPQIRAHRTQPWRSTHEHPTALAHDEDRVELGVLGWMAAVVRELPAGDRTGFLLVLLGRRR